jgi:hypothetical protein
LKEEKGNNMAKIAQGWQCPVCLTVHAPSVTQCSCQGISPGITTKKVREAFTPPPIEDVQSYCQERKNDVDPDKWFNFYTAKNWMIGKNKMKDWKAAVRTWERSKKEQEPLSTKISIRLPQFKKL